MTNGELFLKTFPYVEQDEKWSNILWWTDEKGKRQLLGDVYDSDFWNSEYKEPITKNELLDKIKEDFIARYPRNYAGGLEFGGMFCAFSLNDILQTIDKYKGESEDKK